MDPPDPLTYLPPHPGVPSGARRGDPTRLSPNVSPTCSPSDATPVSGCSRSASAPSHGGDLDDTFESGSRQASEGLVQASGAFFDLRFGGAVCSHKPLPTPAASGPVTAVAAGREGTPAPSSSTTSTQSHFLERTLRLLSRGPDGDVYAPGAGSQSGPRRARLRLLSHHFLPPYPP